jgi:hypothetical protein
MQRKQFEIYRQAFSSCSTCAAGNAAKAACVDGWINDAARSFPHPRM